MPYIGRTPVPRIGDVIDDTTPQLGGDLDANGAQIQWSKGADVVAATALPILTDGNYFDVTGTTAITSINATGGAGTLIKLHFDSTPIITHEATNLILPGGENITAAAGDEAEFIEYAAGKYRCTNYSKANGEAVVGAGVLKGTAFPSPVSAEGTLFYKTDTDILYISNGTQFNLVSNANPSTTGGTVTITALPESGTFSYNLGIDFTDDVDTDAQLTYTLESGTMPSGCTLPTSGNSAFTGTASDVASNTNYTWVIKATDTSGGTATQNYQQTINTVAATVTGGTVSITEIDSGTSASYDVDNNFTWGATGAAFSAYSLQSGTLPNGTSLNTSTGVISGTTSSASTFNFTIRGVDTDGDNVDQTYSWVIATPPFGATGGNITTPTIGGTNYKVHTFLSSATGASGFVPNTTGTVDILVIAGGGGGSGGSGGGGGAGGYVYSTSVSVSATQYNVSVGAGGAAGIGSSGSGSNGINSSIGSLTTTAIGGGGGVVGGPGNSGGSGGGGAQPNYSGGSGTSGQGYAGGTGSGAYHPWGHGGGGGAGAAGQDYNTGTGGIGIQNNIDGNNYYWAGGGGGGAHNGSSTYWSDGGLGGGGGGGGYQDQGVGGGSALNSGANPVSEHGGAGGTNTGGGGGGGSGGAHNGGAGGSGIVIVRYTI